MADLEAVLVAVLEDLLVVVDLAAVLAAADSRAAVRAEAGK